MNRAELTEAAASAIALCVLAKDGFRIHPSHQQLVSAGNIIYPLVAERIDLVDFRPSANSRGLSSERKIRRFVRDFTAVNHDRIGAVLLRNPVIALRIAEILEVDYSPDVEFILKEITPEKDIPRAARSIRDGLESRSLDIVRLVLDPSEDNSDEVTVFFALLVAYLYNNDTLQNFADALTRRYKELTDLVPTRQPSGAIRDPEDFEEFIRDWLPRALFYHAIARRPVNLVIESLVEAELIHSSESPLLPSAVEANLDKVLRLVQRSSRAKTSPISQSPETTDPSQEDVGDLDTVSSIMNHIYNWMGPPPTPISTHPVPSMTSPGSAE